MTTREERLFKALQFVLRELEEAHCRDDFGPYGSFSTYEMELDSYWRSRRECETAIDEVAEQIAREREDEERKNLGGS